MHSAHMAHLPDSIDVSFAMAKTVLQGRQIQLGQQGAVPDPFGDCRWSAACHHRKWNWHRPRNTRPALPPGICCRPADKRTNDRGRVESGHGNGADKFGPVDGFACHCSGEPGTGTRWLMGTDSGCRSRLSQLGNQPGTLVTGFAHADDAASAKVQPGFTHPAQGVQPILETMCADDVVVFVG